MNNKDNERRRAFRFLLASFLILVMLFPIISASSYANQRSIGEIFLNYWAPWSSLILYAISIGLIIYVVAWFYASATSDEKLKAWIKRELVQLVFSAIIFLAVLPVITSIANVSVLLPAYTPWSGSANGAAWVDFVEARCNMQVIGMQRPCHIRIAEDYLQILAKSSQAQIQSALRINSIIAVLSTFSVEFRGMIDPAGQLNITPLVGLGIVSETLQFVIDMQMKNFLSIRAQQYIIDFIHLGFFPMFLVLGIFFRVFYFTRKLGGLFIALAISIYLVYPMMYVFFHAVLFQMAGPWSASSYSNPSTIGTDMFRIDLSFDGMNKEIVQPVVGSPTYNEKISSNNQMYAGKVKGEFCADGILQPWEQCNEPIDAINGSDPKGNKISLIKLSCPAGSYCDTNSCTCKNNFYAGNTGDFRADYLGGKMRNAKIKEQSILLSKICFESYKNKKLDPVIKNKNKAFIYSSKKLWYEKWLESWGGAFDAAFAKDEIIGKDGLIDNSAKLLLFSVLCPFISIMVTLSSVKVMSPLFGGDIEIAGLTRLI